MISSSIQFAMIKENSNRLVWCHPEYEKCSMEDIICSMVKEYLIKIHGFIGSLNFEVILGENKWDIKESIPKEIGILF